VLQVFKNALTLFHEVDTDQNGFIDVDELEIALYINGDMGAMDMNVSALIERFDVSKDGKLDFVEWFFLYDMAAREKVIVCFATRVL
jgi:Ca2+-binding EF-hand superfamily protein